MQYLYNIYILSTSKKPCQLCKMISYNLSVCYLIFDRCWTIALPCWVAEHELHLQILLAADIDHFVFPESILPKKNVLSAKSELDKVKKIPMPGQMHHGNGKPSNAVQPVHSDPNKLARKTVSTANVSIAQLSQNSVKDSKEGWRGPAENPCERLGTPQKKPNFLSQRYTWMFLEYQNSRILLLNWPVW